MKRYLKIVGYMACAVTVSIVVAIMCAYLWLQEEYMNACEEFTE